MKFFKYIIIALASMVALVSCEKHGLGYDCEKVDASKKALVVVWRLIPEASTTANRVYNITIDDQPLWGNNITYMAARDWMPNQSRHYIMEPGEHNMKWYLLDGTLVYDQNFTAIPGMQEVCVTDYNRIGCIPMFGESVAVEHEARSYKVPFLNFLSGIFRPVSFTIPR